MSPTGNAKVIAAASKLAPKFRQVICPPFSLVPFAPSDGTMIIFAFEKMIKQMTDETQVRGWRPATTRAIG
jgi:hypothetical protein